MWQQFEGESSKDCSEFEHWNCKPTIIQCLQTFNHQLEKSTIKVSLHGNRLKYLRWSSLRFFHSSLFLVIKSNVLYLLKRKHLMSSLYFSFGLPIDHYYWLFYMFFRLKYVLSIPFDSEGNRSLLYKSEKVEDRNRYRLHWLLSTAMNTHIYYVRWFVTLLGML